MSVHTCSTERDSVLADGCGRCAEHAANPFAEMDDTHLALIVALAVSPDRFRKAGSEADLLAAKKVLDAIDHAGKLFQAAPALITADLRKRWRVPIHLEV